MSKRHCEFSNVSHLLSGGDSEHKAFKTEK